MTVLYLTCCFHIAFIDFNILTLRDKVVPVIIGINSFICSIGSISLIGYFNESVQLIIFVLGDLRDIGTNFWKLLQKTVLIWQNIKKHPKSYDG